jgi:hypothetical protein
MSDTSEMMNNIDKWKTQGYDVVHLEEMATSNDPGLSKEIEKTEKAILGLERIMDELSNPTLVVYRAIYSNIDRELKEIQGMLHSPRDFEGAVSKFQQLMKDVKKIETKEKLSSSLKKLQETYSPKGEIQEVFLVYKDGRLITHTTVQEKEFWDADIIAGMLTALQDFIKHCLRGEEELRTMEYGNVQIAIESGDHSYLAAIITGKIVDIHIRLERSLTEIEAKFSKQLKYWDGSLDAFPGVDRMMKKV